MQQSTPRGVQFNVGFAAAAPKHVQTWIPEANVHGTNS